MIEKGTALSFRQILTTVSASKYLLTYLLNTHTNKATYHRCIRLFLLLLFLFAVLKLLCDFSFGLGDELSERSAVSYTGDKRMLQTDRHTGRQHEIENFILHKLSG